MKNMPRILPMIGVAMAGVLGINALSGAQSLPDLVSGARAFAEETSKTAKGAKPEEKAATGVARDAAASASLAPSAKPPAVCAPTAAELAKEAGLSPAELQVLQSLGTRRGQLDKREQDLDVQLALMAAAEAKLDAKIKALSGMKGEIQTLMTQAEGKEQAEIDRLVKVFESMKPKDAAPRIVLLDDAVRIPIAAKMKERSLSAILAVMPPAEAKRLTESLASRFTDVKKVAAAAQAAAASPGPQAAAAPAPKGAAPAAKAG
jgi:flagellar motility protein MotE (MotC chaperone)